MSLVFCNELEEIIFIQEGPVVRCEETAQSLVEIHNHQQVAGKPGHVQPERKKHELDLA